MTDSNTLDAEWVTAAVAHKLLGIPVRRVHRLGERGEVQRRLSDPANNRSPWLFFVPELKQFSPNEHAPDPQISLALNQARMLEMAVNTIKEQWKLMHEPMREQLQAYKEENAELRKGYRELADEHIKLVKLREELVDQKHTRELADKMAADAQETKREALELLKRAAPFIWGGVLETISRRQAFGVLRASFTPEQLQVILDADVLSEEQKDLFKEVFKPKAPPAEEPEQGEQPQPEESPP